MKIGIDCRLAGTKHAGIGRYIANLLQELITEKNIHWVLFFYDNQQAESVLGNQLKATNVSVEYVPVKHYTFSEQIKLPKIFANKELDLLHVPHFNIPVFYQGRMVVTIHDLLWHHHRGLQVTTLPSGQYWLKYFFYRTVTRQAVFKAAKVLVPAKEIKKTVTHYYPHAQSKIVVTTEGVEEVFLSAKSSVKRAKNTLLFVGSLYPHKNVRLIILALKLLPEYKLQIVGSRSIFQEETMELIREAGIADRVEFLGYLADRELAKVYSATTALVQPSFSEGFGLTGVEAMATGTPVLASDIPIFKEIYQDAAIYFDPFSTSSFVKAVRKLEKLNLLQHQKILKKVIEPYRWKSTAAQTTAAYREALEK